LRQFRQLNDTASVNARLPYWQTEADGDFSHSDVGPFGNHCSRLSVSNEKAYFVRLVGRIEWCSDQPGVSQCEKYDKKLQAVGQYDRDAVAGLQSGTPQLSGQSLNLVGQSSIADDR
jgi:hypothetical protein